MHALKCCGCKSSCRPSYQEAVCANAYAMSRHDRDAPSSVGSLVILRFDCLRGRSLLLFPCHKFVPPGPMPYYPLCPRVQG